MLHQLGGLKNYKILREQSTSPTKGISTLVCLPITVLNLDSWNFLQPLFAVNQDDIVSIRNLLIFMKHVNHYLCI